MKKNKKIFILIISIIIAIALIAGSYGIYTYLLNQVPERITVEQRSSRFYSLNKSYIVSEYPYINDGVFETVSGLESYYLNNRHDAAAIDVKLQVTKDNKVVVYSDSLNKFSNSHVLYDNTKDISDLTLSELKKVNLAYNYSDENGQMFYKNVDENNIDYVNILTLDEFVNWFNSQRADLPLFAISIYDENSVNDIEAIIAEVDRVFTEINYYNFFFFSTDNQKTANLIDKKYPQMLRSATKKEAKNLFVSCLLNKDTDVSFEIVYTSADCGMFGKFDSEKFITYANNMNVSLILRDVKTESLEKLASLGVDGFTTSDCESYNRILKETYLKQREKASAK